MAVQDPEQWRVLELHMPAPLSPLSRPAPLALSTPRVTLALTVPVASTRPLMTVPESPESELNTPRTILTGYRYPGGRTQEPPSITILTLHAPSNGSANAGMLPSASMFIDHEKNRKWRCLIEGNPTLIDKPPGHSATFHMAPCKSRLHV